MTSDRPFGARTGIRIAAGLAGTVFVAAWVTIASGPVRAELIRHDEALPYRTDRKGRTDVPFEVQLAEKHPEVVVVGSSVVACAFDEAAFEARVGKKSLDLTVAGSMSAVWYLVIKNRVATADPPPKYCILGFRDTYLTVPEYRADGGYKQIVDRYVDGPEPLLDRLAYLEDVGPVEYFFLRCWAPLQRRGEIRDRIESMAKMEVAGQLVGRSPEEMRHAVDVVFANERKVASKLTSKQRRAEALARGNYFDFASECETSFLPEIIRICAEAGVQLVLVRMPIRRNVESRDDRSQWPRALRVELPAYERAMEAFLAERSVPLIDFSDDSRIPLEWFAHGDHLNQEGGRAGFTELLSASFQELLAARSHSSHDPGNETR